MDLAVFGCGPILTSGESARAYYVGSGRSIAIEGLSRMIVKAAGEETPIEIAGTAVPGASPARHVPSVERAQKELGLETLIALEDAVWRTHEWASMSNNIGSR